MQSDVLSEEEAPTLYYVLGEDCEVLAVYKETAHHFHYRQVGQPAWAGPGVRYIGGMKQWKWMRWGLRSGEWDLTRNLKRVEAHIRGGG